MPLFKMVCQLCGKEDLIPSPGPVLCGDCWRKQRQADSSAAPPSRREASEISSTKHGARGTVHDLK